MAKCDCYFQHGRKFLCFGPMYREECPYGGSTDKCKFHQERRKLNAQVKPELIDRRQIRYMWQEFRDGKMSDGVTLQSIIDRMPTVDAVVMPEGKPGDCLEWDNGAGFRQIYRISAVMICEDCVRYDLEKLAPFVDHPNIVRIMTQEEAEKEWRDRVDAERKAEDNTNLKAVP